MANTKVAQSNEILHDLLLAAHEAGMAAGRAAVTPTMVVRRHADPLNDRSPVEHEWIVPEGPCGFAWVTLRPANCKLAKVMKETFNGKFGGEASHDSYEGGMMLWVWEFNQSMIRKQAYADAFVKVLRAAGIERVVSGSRLD